MSKDASFKVVDFESLWLIGKETLVKQGETATEFVKAFRTDGSNAYLQNLADRVSPDGDFIIWMGEYSAQAKTFTEIPGIFVKPGCIVPEGFAVRKLPCCKMAICIITGTTRNLTKGAHNTLVKLMKESGYIPDYSYGFSMEYYSYKEYEQKNDIYKFSYYLPCKKAD